MLLASIHTMFCTLKKKELEPQHSDSPMFVREVIVPAHAWKVGEAERGLAEDLF